MCLNIDGQTFCDVLEAAPRLNGESLERVEHNMEENKRPYTDEVAQLLAQTCGLEFNIYRDRIARIRGENVMKQCHWPITSIVSKDGPYFVLPSACRDYIEGRVHEVPAITCITDRAQRVLEVRLSEYRFAHFCTRIDTGITKADVEAYPEHAVWLPRVEKLWSHGGLTQYCHEVIARREMPSNDMYYLDGHMRRVVEKSMSWFNRGSWRKAPPIIRVFLSPDDLLVMQGYVERDQQMAAVSPKRLPRKLRNKTNIRRWKRERRALRAEYVRWKQGLKERYLPLIYCACQSGLPVRMIERLPKAA